MDLQPAEFRQPPEASRFAVEAAWRVNSRRPSGERKGRKAAEPPISATSAEILAWTLRPGAESSVRRGNASRRTWGKCRRKRAENEIPPRPSASPGCSETPGKERL
ncbi:hypothetical protein GN956_G18680 [Arapaima gigas]